MIKTTLVGLSVSQLDLNTMTFMNTRSSSRLDELSFHIDHAHFKDRLHKAY